MKADLVIIGGGPAGMAAAVAAYDAGVRDIIILERIKKSRYIKIFFGVDI